MKKILKDLKTEPADEKIRGYKSNWLRHVTGMKSNRMPELKLNCRQNGRRRLGRPLKRQFGEAKTNNNKFICFSETQQHFIYLTGDTFRPSDHHQAVDT